MTSSLPSWICAATTSGFELGVLVIASHTSSVCEPVVLLHAAFSPPFISRSSERG